MSRTWRDHTVRVHSQEKWRPGYTVRVYRPSAYIQDNGRAQRQTVAGHILPEAQAQHPTQAARVCLLRYGYPTPDNTQQYAGRGRGVVVKFDRCVFIL